MKLSIFKSLYFQVLTAIAIGILLGHFYPELGAQMKPLGDAFVKLIKMIIAPVIFCTVVTGIAGMESMKAVGRTGAVALLYFEIVSTIALIIGLVIVNLVQPGAGMNVDPATLDAKAVAVYAEQAQQQGGILQGGAQRTRREQVQGQEGEVERPLQQQKSRHAPPAEPLDQNVLLPSAKAVPFSVARMRKKYNPCQQKRTAAPGKRHCGPC